MSRFNRIARSAALLLAALALGCSTGSGENGWYKNRAALASTVLKPVTGPPDERTYVAPEIRGGELGRVYIEAPRIAGTASGPEMERFLERLAKRLAGAVAQVIAESDRGKVVASLDPRPDSIATIDGLAHVATLDSRVARDPVLNDPRSKVFLVFTITDAKSGKVLVRHTTSALSDWEYAPMAMDDLEFEGAKATENLLYVLKNF